MKNRIRKMVRNMTRWAWKPINDMMVDSINDKVRYIQTLERDLKVCRGALQLVGYQKGNMPVRIARRALAKQELMECELKQDHD